MEIAVTVTAESRPALVDSIYPRGDPTMAMPAVGGALEQGFAVEEEGAASLDGEATGAGANHGLDGAHADDGTSKRMSWLGLATLTTVRRRGGLRRVRLRSSDLHQGAGALDGGVGAFHGFNGDAGLRGDDDGLADVEGGDGAGNAQAVLDVAALVFVGGARWVRAPSSASSGSRKAVELMSSMPSSPRTLATAPSSMSVLRVRRLRSSLARRQSGRMLEKICLCLTWPAITALGRLPCGRFQ